VAKAKNEHSTLDTPRRAADLLYGQWRDHAQWRKHESKQRRRQRDQIRAMADEAWGSDWPPEGMSTPDAVQALGKELKRRGVRRIPSEDTLKRAINRR
jgi:hypothetical protein